MMGLVVGIVAIGAGIIKYRLFCLHDIDQVPISHGGLKN